MPRQGCRNLITFEILADKCTAVQFVPVTALSLRSIERKQPLIDTSICISCGICKQSCNFDAIVIK